MTARLRTTCGSRMLDDFAAPYDAHVVDAPRRRRHGARSARPTWTSSRWARPTRTRTSAPVRNPWDTSACPAASSGGSAAAVAARLVPAATGTDTGGSIRQPAAFSGITGLKPTYGACSRYGMIAFASSLDQAGPFARTAEDCALLLNAMAGLRRARLDQRSIARREDYARDDCAGEPSQPLQGLRIGVPREYFGDGIARRRRARHATPRSAEFAALGATTGRRLAAEHRAVDAGVLRDRAGRGVVEPVALRRRALRPSRRASTRDLLDMYKKSRAEGFGAEVKRRILVGTYVLSHGYYDAYYLQAQKVRRLIADDFQARLRAVRRHHRARSRRRRRSDSATRPTIRCRCTWPTSSPSPATSPACPACRSRAASARRTAAAGRPAAASATTSAKRSCSTSRTAFQQATDWHRARRRAA